MAQVRQTTDERPAGRCVLVLLAVVAAALLTPSPGLALQAPRWARIRVQAPPLLDVELSVIPLRQRGNIANCGPTAAAILLGAYHGLTDPTAVERLRDAVGLWTWNRYPMRSWSLPGRDPGATTVGMMEAALERFGGEIRFEPLDHPLLAAEAWSLLALRDAVGSGRPLVALVESSTLWGTSGLGLHWVVVTGVSGDDVLFVDPADAKRWSVPMEQFWRAWRIPGVLSHLPGVHAFAGYVADRPLVPSGRIAPQS